MGVPDQLARRDPFRWRWAAVGAGHWTSQWYATDKVIAGRILIVGDPSGKFVAEQLRAQGLENVTYCSRVTLEEGGIPALLIVLGGDREALCEEARAVPMLQHVPILAGVPSASEGAAQAALASGATDVVREDAPVQVLATRVENLLAMRARKGREEQLQEIHAANLQIQTLIREGGQGPGVLRSVLLVAVEVLGFDRASLIAHIEGSKESYVIAATDDPTLSKFALTTTQYPELDQVLRTGKPVFLHDAQTDPLTTPVAESLKRKGIRGIAAFPVLWQKRSIGVVLFRKGEASISHLTESKREFGQMFATQLAVQLHHRKVMDSLRKQAHRVSSERYEAERRLRTLDSLRDHFEAASDGVVVLDGEGTVLFVNRAAEAMTGFQREEIAGTSLVHFVSQSERGKIERAFESVLSGSNLDAFDLDVRTKKGRLCVSVTTSTVLSDSGAVIFLFRDVTAHRALESELRKTKEFLERLIDSMVDALVAADMRGEVILFNPGAERIYGYRAEEVVGKIPVWKLYPEGVAKQVMRMLRANAYGGVGRLEQTRREILTNTGELVPVNLSASILYEDGVPRATVGIFSDLRERIRMEQKLERAQERLEMTAKQAIVAELAGAAAHELNQPLTSILGYAQLAQRQIGPDHAHARAVGVILREGERMAELVKKIGRITKFETKQYVGSSNILDLDKSSPKNGVRLHNREESESLAIPEERQELGGVGDTDRIDTHAHVDHEQ